MNEIQPKADLADYGVLSESLGTPDIVRLLHAEAEDLLDRAAMPCVVNGEQAEATVQFYAVQNDNEILYARLARMHSSDTGFLDRAPLFIFCDSPEFGDNMTTRYLKALQFRGNSSRLQLFAGGNHKDIVMDDPSYFRLAQDIIKDLSVQFEADQDKMLQLKEQQRIEAKQLAEKAQIEKACRRTRRIKRAQKVGAVVGGTVVSVGLLYGPQALDSDNIDAKIGSFPMPSPVEWAVDANNISDHRAQGFEQPKGALVVNAGDSHASVPLQLDYDTREVPDATDKSTGEVSKPGLYKSTFSFKFPDSKYTTFNGSGCYSISGDFSNDRTSVFTQSLGIKDMIDIKVRDADTLDVCKNPGVPINADAQASIYIYQKPNQTNS